MPKSLDVCNCTLRRKIEFRYWIEVRRRRIKTTQKELVKRGKISNGRRTGGRIGESDFLKAQPSETLAVKEPEAKPQRFGGYQPTKSDPPEKRTPPRGGSNVSPPPT